MRRALALLAFASPAALATTPPPPGQAQRFPPFSLDGPGEHLLFSSMLVSTGPFFFSAASSESSRNDRQQQRLCDDAAAFVASAGGYRTATLEAALREHRARLGGSPDDLLVAAQWLAGGAP